MAVPTCGTVDTYNLRGLDSGIFIKQLFTVNFKEKLKRMAKLVLCTLY